MNTPVDFMRTDFPQDDPALVYFKLDAEKQALSFRAYCRKYGINIMALEQDRRQSEVQLFTNDHEDDE